jgi:hypothetical protein
VLASFSLRVKLRIESSFDERPAGRAVDVYMLSILRQPPKSSSIPAIMMKKVLQPQPG